MSLWMLTSIPFQTSVNYLLHLLVARHLLSLTYQQLLLDPESTKYVAVNTHKGLYRYNRLPFVIASAPATFQKTLYTIFAGYSSSYMLY